MGPSVIVVEYDPSWVRLLEKIRDFVLPVLSDLAITIEHVGSTSVPGLAAKPIVDMDVVVSTQADVHIAIQRLATLGYVHEGDLGATGREAFIPPETDDQGFVPFPVGPKAKTYVSTITNFPAWYMPTNVKHPKEVAQIWQDLILWDWVAKAKKVIAEKQGLASLVDVDAMLKLSDIVQPLFLPGEGAMSNIAWGISTDGKEPETLIESQKQSAQNDINNILNNVKK